MSVASRPSSATRIASIVRAESGCTSSRRGDLAFFTRRAGFAEMCSPTNACSKIEPSRSIAWRTAIGPAPGQAVGLPTSNHLRRDLTQSDRAKVWTEVMVVEACVMEPRLRCEPGGMRCSPGAGHVLAESLRASVKRREASSPPLPSDFRVEGRGRLARRAAVRRVRVHRGVLQPPASPLHPRDALPNRLRTTTTLAAR